MIAVKISVSNPKIVVKKEHNDCRCITIETHTEYQDVFRLTFDSIDDARAYQGLLGIALSKEF